MKKEDDNFNLASVSENLDSLDELIEFSQNLLEEPIQELLDAMAQTPKLILLLLWGLEAIAQDYSFLEFRESLSDYSKESLDQMVKQIEFSELTKARLTVTIHQ